MTIHKELSKIIQTWCGEVEVQSASQLGTTKPFYQEAKQSPVSVKSVSFDDVLASKMQKRGFKEKFRAATKKIGETYYEGEESLKALRLSKGITQTELADVIGSSQPQIYRIEKGISDFHASTVEKLAKFFELPEPKMFEILFNARKPAKES